MIAVNLAKAESQLAHWSLTSSNDVSTQQSRCGRSCILRVAMRMQLLVLTLAVTTTSYDKLKFLGHTLARTTCKLMQC